MTPRPIDPEHGGHRANATVLAYLVRRSAHSDAAEDLVNASRGLDGVEVHCPDPARYS